MRAPGVTGTILFQGGDDVRTSIAPGQDESARAGPSPWADSLRRWFEALNAFLERAFRSADIETGC